MMDMNGGYGPSDQSVSRCAYICINGELNSPSIYPLIRTELARHPDLRTFAILTGKLDGGSFASIHRRQIHWPLINIGPWIPVTAIARSFLLFFVGQLMAPFLCYADLSLASGRVRGQPFRDAITRANRRRICVTVTQNVPLYLPLCLIFATRHFNVSSSEWAVIQLSFRSL